MNYAHAYESLQHLNWAIETGTLMMLVMSCLMFGAFMVNRMSTFDPSHSSKALADEAAYDMRTKLAIVRARRNAIVQQNDMLLTMMAMQHGLDPEALKLADAVIVDHNTVITRRVVHV